jgi:hypothetical protein
VLIYLIEKINHIYRSSIEALENKLNSWNEFDTLKESCLTWLRETDYKIHAIDLKNSLEEKKSQFEELKVICVKLHYTVNVGFLPSLNFFYTFMHILLKNYIYRNYKE